MTTARTPRGIELAIAAAALFGIFASGVSRILAGESGLFGVWPFLFGFFTIWVNALVVLAYGLRWRSGFMRGMTATMIVLVGLVYHFQLSHLRELRDVWQWTGNALTHYAVPMLVFADWLWFGPARTRWRWALSWLLFSIVYTLFALVRGTLTGVYVYPFLDVGTLGWRGFAISVAGMSLGFLIVGLLMVALRKAVARLQGQSTR